MNIEGKKIFEAFWKFFEFTAYFIITVVALSSLGVWLPFSIEKAQSDFISDGTWKGLPWNLFTYSVPIFMISFIDRLIHLLQTTSKFKKNLREFLVLILVLGGGGYLAYQSLVHSRFNRLNESILYAFFFTSVAWFVWVYVKIKTPSYNNYSSIGGAMQ